MVVKSVEVDSVTGTGEPWTFIVVNVGNLVVDVDFSDVGVSEAFPTTGNVDVVC